MHNWQENEIKELLSIRGSEPIRNQITGTVKDSVVYQRMTKLLAERGVHRSHMQVISKLKALRKQYLKHHQQKTRLGTARVDWPFYEQCHGVFGQAAAGSPAKRHRSPSPPPTTTTATPPPPPACSEEEEEEEEAAAAAAEAREVVVGLWDDVDSGDIDKHLEPVKVEDDEQLYNSSDRLPPIKNQETKKKTHQKNERNLDRIRNDEEDEDARKMSGIWTESETKELLLIRADGDIHRQISGTVRDAAVYERITQSMRARGYSRGKSQIISKLKMLRKKFHQISDDDGDGGGRFEWPYFEMCRGIWGTRRPAGSSPELCGGDAATLADTPETSGSPESAQHGESLPAYAVPSKKKKTTVMEQVSTLVSATVSQLREMDAAMQAQEDARLQRLMEHEREMQSDLLRQLGAMHERIGRENHQRQLELVERLLSRFPAPSGPSGPSGR